jgi:ABC-2 type transport system ATP-binding protein
MISASSLTKQFGPTRALNKVSFEVERGEVVGFLGPNGAGKSTTMRILTCFISPTSGSAKVRGVDVFEDPLKVREALGYLPQRAPLYADMNVYEYLRFTARVRGMDDSQFKKRMKKVVEVCGLAQALGKDIGTLSHGFRQRVGLGQALIHDPPILILDEPTSDLDPNEKAEVLKYIKEIGKDRTILLSTHNLAEVEEACARAIIVSKGRVVADGPLDEIRAKTGSVRYIITVDEQKTLGANGSYRANAASAPAPKVAEVQDALGVIDGARNVRELPTDETAHRFEISGDKDSDLRAEIFKLMVDKGWLMLELRRDAQSLDAVFRDLTRGDERLDRGQAYADEYDDEEYDDEELDDEDDEPRDEDLDEDEDEDEDVDDEEPRDEDEDEDEDLDDEDEDEDEDEERKR